MEKKTGSMNMKNECVFCNINLFQKKKIIYEDLDIFIFYDKRQISSQGHILACPKIHIKNTAELNKKEHILLLQNMEKMASKVLMGINSKAKFRY